MRETLQTIALYFTEQDTVLLQLNSWVKVPGLSTEQGKAVLSHSAFTYSINSLYINRNSTESYSEVFQVWGMGRVHRICVFYQLSETAGVRFGDSLMQGEKL